MEGASHRPELIYIKGTTGSGKDTHKGSPEQTKVKKKTKKEKKGLKRPGKWGKEGSGEQKTNVLHGLSKENLGNRGGKSRVGNRRLDC